MSTLICIENATTTDFTLVDQDGQQYGTIVASGYYYRKLRRNISGDRKYTFKNGNSEFYMWTI